MVCKHLISSGLLICVSFLAGCTSSSSKKGQSPTPSTQPANPEQKPTPTPSPTPAPTPAPTPTVTPQTQATPPDFMLGDWQSTFSDPNYFGNVTYTFRADGQVLMSLLIYGKGGSEIMAERHEFKGVFYPKERSVALEQVKGGCTLKNKNVTLSYSNNQWDRDLMYVREAPDNNYLRLSKIKSGLSEDVHTITQLNGYAVSQGCFVEGRLNQFVPQRG
jgi:hypothetical protein